MDIRYILLDKKHAGLAKNYIPEDTLLGFVTQENRFALCAVIDDELCGVGVFDAQNAAEILDIHVLPEWRGRLEQKILHAIVLICERLKCRGIVFTVYDGEDEWEEMLSAEGFEEERTVTLYETLLSSVLENKLFHKAKEGKHVLSLKEVSDPMKKSFSNILIQKHRYDRFMSPLFDGELSTVYLENDNIAGCVLLSVSEEEGITIEYVDTLETSDQTAGMELVTATVRKLRDRYADVKEDPKVYLLAMNPMVDSFVKKILPEAEAVQKCRTYVSVREKGKE